MKIIFSNFTLINSGAERVTSILANALSRLGHTVEILLYYDREIGYEIDPDVKSSDTEFISIMDKLGYKLKDESKNSFF